MSPITLELSEEQIVSWVCQLSPGAKRVILSALVPNFESLESEIEYGNRRLREKCRERGVDWDSLTEEERMKWLDELLHEG